MLKYIIKTIVLLVIFYYLAYVVKRTVSNINTNQITKTSEKKTVYKKIVNNNDIYGQLSDLFFYIIIFIGIIVISLSHGMQTATILTVIGSIGLSIALSSQNILNNVICGIKISFTDIIKIGDDIEIKMVGIPATTIIKGKVSDITLFNTKISVIDTNEQMIIPNSVIENSVVINSSVIYT